MLLHIEHQAHASLDDTTKFLEAKVAGKNLSQILPENEAEDASIIPRDQIGKKNLRWMSEILNIAMAMRK